MAAFLDRVYIVKVAWPTNLRRDQKSTKLLLNRRELAHCALRARHVSIFALLDSFPPEEPENSSIYSKMRVYDGESLKDTDPKKLNRIAGSIATMRVWTKVERVSSPDSPLRSLPAYSTSTMRKWRQAGTSVLRSGTTNRARAVPARVES